MRGAVTSTGNGDLVKLLVSHARARLGYLIVLSLACAAIDTLLARREPRVASEANPFQQAP